MDDEAWREDFEEPQAARPDDPSPTDDEFACADDVASDDAGASFIDQIVRGIWPVRVSMPMEIYVEGSRPQVHPLRPGQRRRNLDSRILTIVIQFDRARVREMMLEQIRAPRDPQDSKLSDLILLARVDRACFLETAAAHFVDLLAETDTALRRDRWLVGFLQELHEYDADLIPDLVAETIRADRAAGARLCDVVLDTLSDPKAREEVGWLVAAAITDRLQES